MSADPWLQLSVLVEPGQADIVPLLAAHEPAEVVAACLGRHRLSVPEAWRDRAVSLDALVAGAASLAAHAGLRWINRESRDWPAALNDLDLAEPASGVGGAPLGLWVRSAGELSMLASPAVAVVGARSCTTYGASVAGEMAADLGEKGWTVVSGAAYGIDASAHRGALAVGGATIAVLACGADLAYPVANTALLERIVASGAVVSEQVPGAVPLKHRFLSRNRIIAALSAGTVVVEAAQRSGSLNTLHWADRLGRACMGVPGPVTAVSSAGVHASLRAGEAVMVTGAADVADELDALGWTAVSVQPNPRGAAAEDLSASPAD